MSVDIVEESVPTYHRRVGDHVLQGSNNSALILGTDRGAPGLASIDSGLGHPKSAGGGLGAGTLHLVSGLVDPGGNPNFKEDKSYVYVSMKTDVDENAGTSSVEVSSKGIPAALVKSDAVRVVARKDVKVVIEGTQSYIFLSKDSCVISLENVGFIRLRDGKIVVDSDKVELGEGATERLMKGDAFMSFFNDHIHPTNVGPSSKPIIPMTAAEHLSSRVILVK